MWKNVIGPDRSQLAIRRMTHSTNTHSEYELLIASLLQQWLHERASLLRHTYNAYLVHFVLGG